MRSEAEHDFALAEARKRLPAEQPTTLYRMRDSASEEAMRIESGQLGRLMSGDITEPWASQMRRRDDFLGIVRLIDLVIHNPVMLEQLRKGMRQP